ncbi:MAG: alpha-E domain-containing protein [Pseudohongiellaceae bacterium]
MLSRVAQRVYWLARYLERAENTARLLNVFSTLLLDLPRGTKVGWHTLVEITGTDGEFDERNRAADERSVIRFLLSESNGLSILNSLAMARENARTAREIIPAEAFEQINNLYIYGKENAAKGISRGPRHELLHQIICNCQQLTGLLAGTMSHNAAYSFIRIGRNLERADMTTRIVDVGSGSLLPDLTSRTDGDGPASEPYENILWMSVLRSISAYQMYRQHVRDRVNAEDVVMFLLQDGLFPRAVVHCLTAAQSSVEDLPHNENVLRQVALALRHAREAKIPELLDGGLFQYLDELQVQIGAVHIRIAETWFLPTNT